MKQLFYFFLILPFLLNSQDFSNEDYVYLKRNAHISIDFEKGNFNIVKNISEQAKFLTGKKLYFANESIGYNGFIEVKDIKAYTLLPDSKEKINVDHIETKQQFDNMVFYSDDAFKSFTFPAVSKGAITNLDYNLIIKEPRFLGGYFNFATYVPTKEANFSVEFPKNVEIGYIDFNTENIQIDFKKVEKKNKNVYTWTVNNIDRFEPEQDSEAVLGMGPVPFEQVPFDQHSPRVLELEEVLHRPGCTCVRRIAPLPAERLGEVVAHDLDVGGNEVRDRWVGAAEQDVLASAFEVVVRDQIRPGPVPARDGLGVGSDLLEVREM